MKSIIITTLLLTPVIGESATVYKCKDEYGMTVFSQQPCGNKSEEIYVTNPQSGLGKPPSNKTAQQQLRDLQALDDRRKRTVKKRKVGGCSYIQSVTRRNMVTSRKLFKCMTKSELQRVLGPPHSRHTGSRGNADESWHYHYEDGPSIHVFFDAAGLVESWSGWR